MHKGSELASALLQRITSASSECTSIIILVHLDDAIGCLCKPVLVLGISNSDVAVKQYNHGSECVHDVAEKYS